MAEGFLDDQDDGDPGVRLAVSDQAELRPLRKWLGRAPDVDVVQVGGSSAAGELGAWDLLQLTAAAGGGGAVAMAIRTLPEFLRSRRSDVEITVTVRGRQVMLRASNIDDVLPILNRLLDDQQSSS
jgi:hypothetical protein